MHNRRTKDGKLDGNSQIRSAAAAMVPIVTRALGAKARNMVAVDKAKQ